MILLDFLYILRYNNTINNNGKNMKYIRYIKKYAKNMLSEWKKLPEYQNFRDRVGTENLTLPFAKNSIAQLCNFKSWEELLRASPEHKHFIKLVLSHPNIYDEGYFDKNNAPEWTTSKRNDWHSFWINNITEAHQYERICKMSKKIKELITPIKSINYKTGHEEIYYVVGKEILRDDLPCGNVFIHEFIFAMLLAGFKMVQSPIKQKFLFNASQKQLKRIQQTQQLYKELFGYTDRVVVDHMYDYATKYMKTHGEPVIV